MTPLSVRVSWVLALFFEVIYEEVVDFFSRGDKEKLVSFGKPLGPQVVCGTGNGRCDLTGFDIVDLDVKLVVVSCCYRQSCCRPVRRWDGPLAGVSR